MRLISWNINGIRAIQKKGFFEWLVKDSVDILCLQETKIDLTKLNASLTDIKGYHSFWCSAKKKGYSGVAIYTKQKPITVEYGLGKEEFDDEGRVLIVDYGSFLLFNVYFPNGGSGNKRVPFKMKFYDAFLNRVEKERKGGKKIIICGDVNTAHEEIDLARPKENQKNTGFLPEERLWVSKFLSQGYIDTFRYFEKDGGHYSWWDYKTSARVRNVGWRIDYCFIDQSLLPCLKKAFILKDVIGSDHCPVGIEITEKLK